MPEHDEAQQVFSQSEDHEEGNSVEEGNQTESDTAVGEANASKQGDNCNNGVHKDRDNQPEECTGASSRHLEKTASEKRLFDLMHTVKDDRIRASLADILDREQHIKEQVLNMANTERLISAITVETKKRECERIFHEIDEAFEKLSAVTLERK